MTLRSVHPQAEAVFDQTKRPRLGLDPRSERSAEDLLHRLALGQFVDQLVQVADLLHERILDRLDPDDPWVDSTRTPQTTPVIADAFGFSRASAKNCSKVVPESRCCCSAGWSYPVSHRITSSTSDLARPFRLTLVT